MPFTTSHPLVILPLKKLWPRYFSLTGLIAGAMSPDLQYFLLANTAFRGASHSWVGLFTVCLPLGLLFCFAFHWLFKRPFIAHLPRPLERALSGLSRTIFRPRGGRQWLVLLLSVLIGALSHFGWDSFTHYDGVMAQKIPWLHEQSALFGILRHNTRWLQHLSSLLGAVGLLVGLWKWKLLPPSVTTTNDRTTGQKIRFWLLGSICSLALGFLAVWFYSNLKGVLVLQESFQYLKISSFGLSSWAGFYWYTCLYGLIKRNR